MLVFSKSNIILNVKLNNVSLVTSDHAKYLKVIIDKRLNWKKQITHVKRKISRGLGII